MLTKRRLNWPLLALTPIRYGSGTYQIKCWYQGYEVFKEWSINPYNHEQLYGFMLGARAMASFADDTAITMVVRELGFDDASLAYLRHALAGIWTIFMKRVFTFIPFEGTEVTFCDQPVTEPTMEEWHQLTFSFNTTLVGLREEGGYRAGEELRLEMIQQAFSCIDPPAAYQVLSLLRGACCFATITQNSFRAGGEDNELVYSMAPYGYQNMVLDYRSLLPSAVLFELEAGREGL